MKHIGELSKLEVKQLIEALEGRLPAPSEMLPTEWRSLLEVLTSATAAAVDDALGESWQALASCYSEVLDLAAEAEAIDRREQVLRLVNFRAGLIGRLGPEDNSGVLDPSALVQVVLQEIPIPLERARIDAENWRAADRATIRDLRYVKNLLSPLASLARRNQSFGKDLAIDQWLGILAKLP